MKHPRADRHSPADREPLGAEEIDRAPQWVTDPHGRREDRTSVLEQKATLVATAQAAARAKPTIMLESLASSAQNAELEFERPNRLVGWDQLFVGLSRPSLPYERRPTREDENRAFVGEHNGDHAWHADSTGRAEDRAALEAERGAAESDQNFSDTDQTLSDVDQGLAETDQERSDADQVASDRDQAASDQELAAHPSEEMKTAHAVSEADRSRSRAEREAGTEFRVGSMFQRVANATRRDEGASLRDMQAMVRDRTADLRDQASADHERALGRSSGYPARARANAAEDRAQAAEDRKRASEDRKRAAEDREHALAELEKAQLDELTGFYRRGLGQAMLQREIDRAHATEDRLVFAYCHVEGLKPSDDTHGRPDVLLQATAAAIRSRLRSYDSVMRIGGDEFICALPGADLDEAANIMRDIRDALTDAQPQVTMRVGLGALDPDDSAATLIKRSATRSAQ